MSDLCTEIVNATHALIVAVDADGRVVTFNAACERLTGYRFEEVQGLPFWDLPLLLSDEPGAAMVLFEKLKEGHSSRVHESSCTTKSGERRCIEWSFAPIKDAQGRVVHVIGTGIDVTEKREAERAMKEEEERFRHLAENIPLVFWAREVPDDRISYVSPAYEQVWGRKLGDLNEAYQSFAQSIHPDDREALFRQIRNEAGGCAGTDNEYRIIRPDGTIRWIHSSAIPVRGKSGQVRRVIGFAEDITERKLGEQMLRETAQSQRALLDSIPDAAWLMNADGRFIAVNRTYAARWGFDQSNAIGKTIFEIFPAPAAAERVDENSEVIRTGKPLHAERRRMIDGKERWLEVTKVPFADDAGKVIGIACISRDITERKLAEAQRLSRDLGLRATLIRDIHHRVKNSLQGTIALMQQLARGNAGSEALMDAVSARLNAIATVHGVYGAAGEYDLRLQQILLALVSSLKTIHPDFPVRLTLLSSAENAMVAQREIVPFALVVNELIMNAVKHSGGGVNDVTVEIASAGTSDSALVIISNSAGRLPEHFDFGAGAGVGTGLRLVKAMLPPAGAELRFENAAGAAGVKAELTLCPPVIASS